MYNLIMKLFGICIRILYIVLKTKVFSSYFNYSLINLRWLDWGAWVALSVKRLPPAQVMIPGSWDQVLHWAPCSVESPLLPLPAAPPAVLSLSLCRSLSLTNKIFKKGNAFTKVENAKFPTINLAIIWSYYCFMRKAWENKGAKSDMAY